MNRRRFVMLSVLGLLLAAPWIFGGEGKRLDEGMRRRVPGSFAKLQYGRTRFTLAGPKSAEAVVFVHGLTMPYPVWGPLPEQLRDAGFLTLVYDLFGRGWSDRPMRDYDLDLFDRQLHGLLGKTGLRKPVHLVGLSMGAIIVTEFALRHPDRVSSVTLIDPAGFLVEPPPFSGLVRFPLLGDWLMQVFGDRVLTSGIARSVHDQSLVRDLERKFRPPLEIRGTKRAILSSLRRMPLSDFTQRYAELGDAGIPVEVFWGTEDAITPFSGAEVAARLLPSAKIHAVEGAGHLAHYEKPGAVFSRLLPFLREVEAPEQSGQAPNDTRAARRIEKGAPEKACEECEPDRERRPPTGSYVRPKRRAPGGPGRE